MVSAIKRLFSHKGRAQADMTQGSITRHLILYALPLFFANLLQYLYSAVDAWVLGQSGQTEAYAAVGSLSAVTQTLVALFWGFSQGAGIVISRSFGAKDERRVLKTAHTAMVVTILIGLFLTTVGMLFSPYLLRIVLGADGNPEIYRHAKTYLLIFFGGITPMLVYNMGAEICRAVGNARYPSLFLTVGSILNIILDIVFVFGFDYGVAGVAWATVLAQVISSGLTVAILFSKHSPVRLSPKQLRIDGSLTKEIIILGIPIAVSSSITSLSGLFVQSYIAGADGDQTMILAGYTTFSKVISILQQPKAALHVAGAVFVAQNLGAKNLDRVKRALRLLILLSLGFMLPIYLCTVIFAEKLPYLFVSDPAVTALTATLFRTITLFYLFDCVSGATANTLRGAGKTGVMMATTLSIHVALRQIYLFTVSRFISNHYLAIMFSLPFASIVYCAVITLLCMRHLRRLQREDTLSL